MTWRIPETVQGCKESDVTERLSLLCQAQGDIPGCCLKKLCVPKPENLMKGFITGDQSGVSDKIGGEYGFYPLNFVFGVWSPDVDEILWSI